MWNMIDLRFRVKKREYEKGKKNTTRNNHDGVNDNPDENHFFRTFPP